MSGDLFHAIEEHDASRVAQLLREGADANACQPDWPKFTALQAAINELEEGGPLSIVTLLLQHGAAVDGWDVDHDATPLLMALFREQREAAKILLDAGADPNVRGGEGDSPLRLCVDRQDYELAELLLAKGAAKSIDDCGQPRGLTPLGIATEKLDLKMMQILLAAGADPGARDQDSMTARERMPSRSASSPAQRAEALELLARARGVN